MTFSYNGQDRFAQNLRNAKRLSQKTLKPVLTGFLSLHEQKILQQTLSVSDYVLYGGRQDAQRKRAAISPYPVSQPVVSVLYARADSRFKTVRHPDVLGAILHLGLERDVIGDIFASEEGIWIVCDPEIAGFLQTSLTRIASMPVSFVPAEEDEMPADQTETLRINTASLRLDAVVAALAHTSRSKAMELIRHQMVKVNDSILEDTVILCNNDVVSIRRCGRFICRGVQNQTRKGRLVVEFEKYQ